MRLRSLEIHGFKSFPDKTRLSFGDGITAVVGPNGSGKSNIADAVRWVLGEQSTKTLRGNKMEDVIFGGTQTRKPVGYASVSLTIDNADRALPMEEDLITITRRLYRSGESEYRINGSMVRLKDVHELLMDTGLGRDGYSIIGQGRIAEIVSAKPVGRREIFEEAAGIAKYRYRKEEAEKKLGQAEENLLRLRDILSELEARVEPLRQQAEKAKEFLTLSAEKKILEISLWIASLDRLKEQLSAQQDKVYLCKNDYERLEEEASALEAGINNAFDRAQRLLMHAEQLRAGVRELEEVLSRGESEAAVLQNDIRHNELSIERVEKEMATADLNSDDLMAQIDAKRGELSESAGNLSLLDGKIAAAEERLAEQRILAERVAAEIAELRVRHNSVSEASAEAKLEKAAGAGLIEESAKRLEALGQNRGAYDSAVTELEQNISECERRISEEEDRLSSIGNTCKGYEMKRQSRAAKLDGLLQKVRELQDSAARKRQRAKVLEDMEASMEGFGGSVKYILGEAKKGALGGVFGAVSSLIDTQSRYNLAIETALGAAMQNIVVADENTAKRAIRMLQNAKAGRATFLPLTTVKGGGGFQKAGIEGHEGFIGAASELVRTDDRFKGVISQLLGRVAVAEDLDSATKIAKLSGYKFRIVTLDGQVINAGGSFTGGSTGKSAGVLGRRAEIERLNGEAAELIAEVEKIEPEQKAATGELAAIDAYISGARAEEQTAREEKMRLGFSLETLKKDLEQAKNNHATAARELKQLMERIEQLRGNDEASAKIMEELEAQLGGLGSKLEAAESRRDTLNLGIEAAVQTVSEQKLYRISAQKDHELLEQELARKLEAAETAGTRVEQLKSEREGYIAENDGIKGKIAEMEVRKEKLKAEIEKSNAEIADMMRRRTEVEATTTELRMQEKELASRREGVSRELARLEERRGSLQSDYDAIIAKLWDEYELTRREAAALAEPVSGIEKANRRLNELRGKIKALGSVNVEAVEEYASVSERYEFLTAQVEDVESAKARLTKMIAELTQEMRDIFIENFTKIAENFSKVFVRLFGGGKAELTLTQEEDVLKSGVEIFVQPPGKIIKNLTLLSGGEQAFVAIAIYFAILRVRPAPFCLLDEIEAALDDVNVVRYANYLRRMCGKTQFIAITHRRGTMEEADMLYGVTMQEEGVSKLLDLNIGEVEEKLGIKNL